MVVDERSGRIAAQGELDGVIERVVGEVFIELGHVLQEPFADAGVIGAVGAVRIIGEELEKPFRFAHEGLAAERKGGQEKIGIVGTDVEG